MSELHHVMQSRIHEFCPTTNSISKKIFLQMFYQLFTAKYLKKLEKTKFECNILKLRST